MDTESAPGLEIRRARKGAGSTQGEPAALAEISERTVHALETATGNPSLRVLASVLNVLGSAWRRAMTPDLQRLGFIERAYGYKNGSHAGTLSRTAAGGIRFGYLASYLAGGNAPVAFSLRLENAAVETPNDALPAFFAGLLPEGHRPTGLMNATKTGFDDELTLPLAVGADAPGDTSTPEDLDFAVLANSVDLHALPGVQDKASASMLPMPLVTRGLHDPLKLDPAQNPHLVANEAAHLAGQGT